MITRKEIKKIYKDYYHRGMSQKQVSKKLGISRGVVGYHLGKCKLSHIDYLCKIYSKKYLISLLSNDTYRDVADYLSIPWSRFRTMCVRKDIKRSSCYFVKNKIDKSFYRDKPLAL